MIAKAKLCLKKIRLDKQLKIHQIAVQEYNAKVLPEALLIAGIITLIPLIISIFRSSMFVAFPGYLVAFLASVLLLIIFKSKKMLKYALIGAYLLMLIAYSLVLFLSVFIYNEYPAATPLIYFALITLLFIDYPLRINLLITFFYIVHTVLSFIFKGSTLGLVDSLNAFISLTLGILFGRLFLRSRLDTFEVRAQLIIEKETDVLTGLQNRRKLFETINRCEDNSTACPCALMMIDIDNFKVFNDRFGHRVGDEYLKQFGQFLVNYQKDNNIFFYRYGGEEFVAMVYHLSKEKILELAELVRQQTMEIPVNGEPITISIGVVFCDQHVHGHHETIISQADAALYRAKAHGRNRVELWNENIVRAEAE